MGHSGFISALGAILLAACGVIEKREKEVHVEVVLADTSEESLLARRCDEVAARADAAISSAGRHPVELQVLTLSDRANGDEPQVLLDWRRYKRARHLYGGREAHAEEAAAWIDELRRDCAAAISPSKTSPIARGIQRAVESLASKCAETKTGERCITRLSALSDFAESQQSAIAAHLRGAKRAPTLPAISLEGVDDVYLCGVAGRTSATGPTLPPDRIRSVWSKVLGRDNLAIAPHCPTLKVKE